MPLEIAVPSTQALLFWWETEGRRDSAQKPWMFKADGLWPEPDDALDPYGVLVAEVMLQFPAHCPWLLGRCLESPMRLSI